MKDFYNVREGKDKRQTVLETIKPICDVFGITDYDYIIDKEHTRMYDETLVVEGFEINCSWDSIGAVVSELVAYIHKKMGGGTFTIRNWE